MDKDGAAAASDARERVVINLNDEVVEIIRAREAIGIRAKRQLYRLVVVTVARILAPAVVGANSPRRQESAWTRVPVGAPPQPLEPEVAARGCPVAFALVGLVTAAPELHGCRQLTRHQDAAPRLARLAPDHQPLQRSVRFCSRHAENLIKSMLNTVRACSFSPGCSTSRIIPWILLSDAQQAYHSDCRRRCGAA